MSVYQMASMLAGQFALVLQHRKDMTRGGIWVVPEVAKHEFTGERIEPGVYINPKDAEY